MRPDKRRRIAKETLEIYAQIANRLGLNNAYQELQDLSFQNLHPSRYETLKKAMDNSRKNRRDVVGKVLRAFSQRLVGANIEAKIKGREKTCTASIKKCWRKNCALPKSWTFTDSASSSTAFPRVTPHWARCTISISQTRPLQRLYRHPEKQRLPKPAHDPGWSLRLAH